MERGTEGERRAVRERWAAMERKRASATRLLGGLTLVGVGLTLVVLAAANDVCFVTARGGITGCEPMGRPALGILFAILGTLALVGGLWNCWSVFRG